MKRLTTLQQSKIMYMIQIGIVIWCIRTFIKYAFAFKLWFTVVSFVMFGYVLIQLCCRFIEVARLKDLEKEENK